MSMSCQCHAAKASTISKSATNLFKARGRYHYQSLKKMYAARYYDYKLSMWFDSEGELLKPLSSPRCTATSPFPSAAPRPPRGASALKYPGSVTGDPGGGVRGGGGGLPLRKTGIRRAPPLPPNRTNSMDSSCHAAPGRRFFRSHARSPVRSR